MQNYKSIRDYTKLKYGIHVIDIDLHQLSPQTMPDKIRGETPTINQYGYMKGELDEFSKEFIKYASNTNDIVLELGSAYGFIINEVLQKNKTIIANDISAEHLEILLHNVNKDFFKNLFLYPGAFPDEVEFEDESIGAILSSRMLHFLTGTKLERGLKKINKWLKREGKFFFVSLSPKHYTLKKDFYPIYKQKLANGEKWPGIVNQMKCYAKDHADYLGNFMHVFDIDQLQKLLPEYGFSIDKIKLFDYQNNDSNGEGHIGFVATKL